MTRHSTVGLPSIPLAAIERLCGKRVYQRAEEYFLAGAVINPRLKDDLLVAEVAGSQEEPYEVTIELGETDVGVRCTCPYDVGCCKHIGAVLLMWARQPHRFAQSSDDDDDEIEPQKNGRKPHAPAGGWRPPPSPQAAMENLLSQRTVQELREIARRREISLRGTAKDDLLRQLIAGLLDPDGVRAAVSSLGRVELACLDAVYVLSESPTYADTLKTRLASVLPDVTEDVSRVLVDLRDVAMLASGPRGISQEECYTSCGNVVSYLPPTVLVAGSPAVSLPNIQPVPPAMTPDELLYIVHGYLSRNAVRKRTAEPTEVMAQYAAFLRGWRNDEGELLDLERRRKPLAWNEQVVLTALAPLPVLSDADLANLRAPTGLDKGAIEFYFHLLCRLDLVKGRDRFVAQESGMREFLSMPPVWRQRAVFEAWLQLLDWSELTPVLRRHSNLRLRRKAGRTIELGADDFNRQLQAGRGMVVRLMARLDEAAWHSLPAIVEAVRRLAWQQFSGRTLSTQGYEPQWWLESDGVKQLDARVAEDWARGYGRIVAEIVRGPLSWLGIATVAMAEGGEVFRLNGLRWLLGLDQPPDEPIRPLEVSENLVVTVPANHEGGLAVHDFLQAIAEPGEATPEGISYRLTPRRACAAFAAGHDNDEIIAFLDRTTGGSLPASVVDTVSDWWHRYGMIRLYGGFTLLEFADDFTLPELLAGTSLAMHLVYRFSPRAIAIDPASADALVQELVRKGYTPKVEGQSA